ncbi:MAG TPA: hypothetical protein VEL11_15330, partial [Candidatus Bathyarchaeia archaeon]|nr:hypothetical protein [Candidatus Bathyarchaeia archaeon]
TINSVYVLYGYIIGAFVNVVLLGLSASSILGKNLLSRLGRGFVSIPKIIAKEYWGILFQTLSVIALFLDKILVWLWKGMQAGNGLQIIGSYTTGTFLGLIPTFSLFGLSHFAEKVRPLSKNMYSGTLDDIQKRVNELKQHYRRNLLITFLIWLAVFAIVVILSIFLIRDFTITRTVVLTGVAVLFLETILFNSIILPIFKKTYLSTFSMLAVCVCVGLSFLFGNSELNLSIGFVVGAFIGFLISHLATMKQLADFEYNAFRAFQRAD